MDELMYTDEELLHSDFLALWKQSIADGDPISTTVIDMCLDYESDDLSDGIALDAALAARQLAMSDPEGNHERIRRLLTWDGDPEVRSNAGEGIEDAFEAGYLSVDYMLSLPFRYVIRVMDDEGNQRWKFDTENDSREAITTLSWWETRMKRRS